MQTPNSTTNALDKGLQDLDQVVIRFAGDSGAGMQLTGDQFTRTTALMGNDIATFPDFPAEIRAPAGTLPGVSAFQLRFSSYDIHTPGDAPDVLVAMNPAALKVHLKELKKDGILLLNTASFSALDLKKAKYEKDPRNDDTLSGYRVIEVPVARPRSLEQMIEPAFLETRKRLDALIHPPGERVDDEPMLPVRRLVDPADDVLDGEAVDGDYLVVLHPAYQLGSTAIPLDNPRLRAVHRPVPGDEFVLPPEPPAETPLEPANRGLIPNGAMVSPQSSSPPPQYSQHMISGPVRPNPPSPPPGVSLGR